VADSQWKPNTHQKAVQALQYFYQWAHARGLVEDDASALLRAARAPRPVPNPCPEDVYRAALEQAEGQDFWRLRLAGETGMRRAELAAAHASHVSELVNGYAIRVNGKGGKTRWIPLSPDLALWVRMQRGYVFPNGSGEHLTPSTVGGWYRRALGINVHSLRHRFATIAYHAQRDINAVCELLGHSSIATTQIYVRVSNDDLRQAASAVWDASMFATHGVPVGDQANVIRLVQSS
jgi:integrase